MRIGGLKFGGHLDRYVGSLFLSSYVTAFLVVVGLFFILDMAGNLDDFLEPWPDGRSAAGMTVVRYYLLNLPFLYMQSAPFVTLTAALFALSRLLKHNEVSAALSAGVSSHRVLMPIFLGAFGVAAGIFALREWAASHVAAGRAALLYELEEQTTDRVYENLWLRDLSGARVRLENFRPAADGDPPRAEVQGLDVTMSRGDIVTSIKADKAIWASDGESEFWHLENAIRFDVGEEEAQRHPDRLDVVEFTPELALSFQRASDMPLDLSFAETRVLARCDPDNVLYQTLMQYHLTFPLANVVLLLVGLPLMLRQERGRAVERLAGGLILCIFFFAADFVFRNLGMQGALHPLMASWVPLLFFGSLGIVLFDSMRT